MMPVTTKYYQKSFVYHTGMAISSLRKLFKNSLNPLLALIKRLSVIGKWSALIIFFFRNIGWYNSFTVLRCIRHWSNRILESCVRIWSIRIRCKLNVPSLFHFGELLIHFVDVCILQTDCIHHVHWGWSRQHIPIEMINVWHFFVTQPNCLFLYVLQ
jgi:hypothetical protein